MQSIDGKDNAIGGASPEARNLISGNGGDGVNIGFESASSNKIVDNLTDTNKDGTSALGNDENGVLINGSPNTTVGGALPGAANTIAFNGGDGLALSDGTGNRILGNSIFSNGGLGIDLANDGRTPNDPKDPDSGPNNQQYVPVLASTKQFSVDKTIIAGKLDSTPSTKRKKRSFTLQFFSKPIGQGGKPPRYDPPVGGSVATPSAPAVTHVRRVLGTPRVYD